MKTKKLVKHDPAPGYVMTVGGHHPYVCGTFVCSIGDPRAAAKVEEQRSQPYHKVRPAVVLTLADYRRLLRASK